MRNEEFSCAMQARRTAILHSSFNNFLLLVVLSLQGERCREVVLSLFFEN